MSERNSKFDKTLPLLGSEKSLLVARSFSPHQDPFVGLVEGRLKPFVNRGHLSRAYQAVVFSKTTFQLLFEKQENFFLKTLWSPAFKGIREFKNKEAFLLWKKTTLDFETGPLQEMVVYKTFFETILCFKFHHLILDGFSLFVFFQELTEAYYESLSGNLTKKPKIDLDIYQQLMKDFSQQEKENKEIKTEFWKNHLQKYKKKRDERDCFSKNLKYPTLSKKTNGLIVNPVKSFKDRFFQFQTQLKSSESFFLRRKHLQKIYNFKTREKIGLFYLFSSLYSKALYKALDTNFICLRVPFSSRYHLKQTDQKNILASLSRSVPLFIDDPLPPLKQLALAIQKQSHLVREHLIMDSSPWTGEDLESFSGKKNQNLSLSMSYLPYTEKGFFGRIQNFYWLRSFLDLVLFVILSEKRILLSFSYKPEIFSKQEIRILAKCFQKEIEDMQL